MVKIEITRDIRNKLTKLGFKNSTWTEIIQSLLKHSNNCDKFWGERFG